ncbi:uncharacterized protein BJ212DRAFT_1349325 [Suillus subaureus]|uniref:Secreted protein n=1 Tax=Suillus subaureus TaxID=48587 RepID=A0A9P7EDV6_9AGAM|nr:uncharacterized protein BJ212DRAFT_1349325 [Suillus subaureus]KAG1818177.1 hypothetical protein BJ212DRAFT_1349325 [Suillus subaureus]
MQHFLCLSILGSDFAIFSFATRFVTSQTTACITYGSWTLISCQRMGVPCVGMVVLPCCVRTMDSGGHWASVSSEWKGATLTAQTTRTIILDLGVSH